MAPLVGGAVRVAHIGLAAHMLVAVPRGDKAPWPVAGSLPLVVHTLHRTLLLVLVVSHNLHKKPFVSNSLSLNHTAIKLTRAKFTLYLNSWWLIMRKSHTSALFLLLLLGIQILEF